VERTTTILNKNPELLMLLSGLTDKEIEDKVTGLVKTAA